jgi:hypothetical protein
MEQYLVIIENLSFLVSVSVRAKQSISGYQLPVTSFPGHAGLIAYIMLRIAFGLLYGPVRCAT